DRFDFEFFGVTLTTHDTSYLGLIMRLGGVYETRGDSVHDYFYHTRQPLDPALLENKHLHTILKEMGDGYDNMR
ncbi:hypothetical protein ACNE9Y_32620, partial [Pseudomonas sp. NY11226]|uniref:hypothetical protein n=1 Tax=Pseudomonas sp. NY11226 TaxID=3400362 RepID=UPI003A8B48E9